MRALALIFTLLVGLAGNAAGKTYTLAGNHGRIAIPDDWHEITKDPDDLLEVQNDNTDSLTISIVPASIHINVSASSLETNVSANLVKAGFVIARHGSLQFHGEPAVYVVATRTLLMMTFYTYEILLAEGNDILIFTLVGDTDPSKDPQFQKILDTFSPPPPAPPKK